MKYTPKSIEWFKDRIGKIVYRDDVGCVCYDCRYFLLNGITVHDEAHAKYLAGIDSDFGAEGVFCNYRDEK